MKFECDPAKSESNKAKHGIDFEEARNLWKDAYALLGAASGTDEPRWLLTAEYESRLWTAVITYRDTAIRIISVRRSRKDEVARYEKRKEEARANQREGV